MASSLVLKKTEVEVEWRVPWLWHLTELPKWKSHARVQVPSSQELGKSYDKMLGNS